MWFIGINPEDSLPDKSLLSKFRTMRLTESNLDNILIEIVRQCIEKGIISAEDGLAIDTTHILANTTKKVPERLMKHLAKKIFKAEGIDNYTIPDYKSLEDHKEAKRVMKEFLENTIENATEKSSAEVKEAKDVLESPLFIEQKGIRSLVDKDARVGWKSHTQNFYGYKAEYSLTTDAGIITSVSVNNGAYVDGDNFEFIYNNSVASELVVNEFFGDKAYFRKDILDTLKENSVDAYIPVNASSYKVNEELYSYNKDSDQWFCIAGNKTVRKKEATVRKRGKDYKVLNYYFEREKCRNCSHRAECIRKSSTIGKVFQVSINTAEYYEYSQREKLPEFKKNYKKRASIERKNAEMKRFHNLARARGYGLRSVSVQAKLTAIAVNLKRISRLISPLNIDDLANLYIVILNFSANFIIGRET